MPAPMMMGGGGLAADEGQCANVLRYKSARRFLVFDTIIDITQHNGRIVPFCGVDCVADDAFESVIFYFLR